MRTAISSRFRVLRCLPAALLAALLPQIDGADPLHVYSAPAGSGGGIRSFADVLRDESYAIFAKRRADYETVKTADDVRRWQKERRAILTRQLGSFPERSPLNGKVVGQLQGDGYRVENVIYDSQPNHRIVANLYLPLTAPPYPAVIVTSGHNFDGKVAEVHQRLGVLLARNGIAALLYEAIGHGERYQTFDSKGERLPREYPQTEGHKKMLAEVPLQPRFNPVEEHVLVGIGSILVGRGAATYRIFDGMRSIDYLVSRPDINPQRIGCTGNSGGGTLTSYLMALDDRILSAAPACWLQPFKSLLEIPVPPGGPQDAEQNIFGLIGLGFEQNDYALIRAPKPTTLLAGTRDVTFNIAGTWEIFREAKRFYQRLGYPERMDMVEADEPHGFTLPLRVGAARTMRRWLLDKDDAVEEADMKLWDFKDLRCTPEGQVMRLPGERSVFDLNRTEAEHLAGERAALWRNSGREKALQAVRKTAGVRPLGEIPGMKSRTVGTVDRGNYQIRKLVIEGGSMPLPALEFVPVRPAKGTYLYLHGEGKQADAGLGGPIEALVRQDFRVLAVDLPGIGETSDVVPTNKHWNYWARVLFGRETEVFWLSYLLGKPLVGLRAENALALARFLREDTGKGQTPLPLHLVGVGKAGLPALHAAALEPRMFATLKLQHTLRSWDEVVKAPLGTDHLTETIHGVLGVYDIPDLLRDIAPVRVSIENPIVPK